MVRVNRSMRRSKSYRNKNQKRTKGTKTKRNRTRSKSQIRRKRGGGDAQTRLLPDPPRDPRVVTETVSDLVRQEGYPVIPGHVYVRKDTKENGKYYISRGMGNPIYEATIHGKFEGAKTIVFKVESSFTVFINEQSKYEDIKANFVFGQASNYGLERGDVTGLLIFPSSPDESYNTFINEKDIVDIGSTEDQKEEYIPTL